MLSLIDTLSRWMRCPLNTIVFPMYELVLSDSRFILPTMGVQLSCSMLSTSVSIKPFKWRDSRPRLRVRVPRPSLLFFVPAPHLSAPQVPSTKSARALLPCSIRYAIVRFFVP